MATDKEIKLNVNDSAFNQLRQKAEDLSRDMIRASREFATSGDEVIADLQEQISLMEKRNEINEQFARSQIEQARQAGQPVPQQQQQVIQEAGENKILLDLVREMIETLKQTSKDEIRADREDVERRIRASRTVGQLSPAGDPFQLLQETLQRQYLGQEPGDAPGETQTQQARNRQSRRGEKLRTRVRRAINKAATAENEYTFLTSFLEGVPFVGHAAATVAARGIANAENFEKAAIAYGRFNRYERPNDPLGEGRAVGRFLGFDANRYGLTPGEALTRNVAFETAMQGDLTGSAFLNLVGAQRVLGLDQNMMTQVLRSARYDQGVADPSRIFAQFDKFTKDTGQAITVIPELIGTFTNAANNILATRGDVDTQGLAAVITNIGRVTGFRGQRLDRLTGAFGQLGRTANPVTRALLMRSFRETDPNLSFVDIQERLEGGLSEESRPGLQRFFEIMRERTGGGDALTLALQTALPQLSIRDIRDVIKSGGFSKALQREQIADPRDFATEAGKFISPIERSSKQISTALELAGDGIVNAIDALKEKIFDAIDAFETKRDVTPEKTEAEKIVETNTQGAQAFPI